jgi:hypothetical protein
MILTKSNWLVYAGRLCNGIPDATPEDFSPKVMERFMEDFDDYIISIDNVRPQFHARNSVRMIDFECEKDRHDYKMALEHFEREKAKLQKKEFQTGQSQGMCILAQLIIFQQAAERIKARSIAKAMHLAVKNGKAAVAAFKYKIPISKAVKILVREYGVKRDEISIIWGGGNTKVSKAKKKKLDVLDKLENNQQLSAILAEAGIDLYDIGLGTVSKPVQVVDDEEDKDLMLGAQSLEQRQIEIDRFQSGKSLYCFFTFKAGGVGLSLHHSDELTTFKCRRKESGYAFEEDIPLVPVRPREMYCAVTYNAVELVQGLGRCPRITSLSDTTQVLLFYIHTIEEHIAKIVSIKLRCLQKVVRTKESWDDIILNDNHRSKYSAEAESIALIENGQKEIVDEDYLLSEGEDEDDEDIGEE